MTGCGWMWLYLGAFLMLLELVSPGFVIFFFGLSAATVGLCRFAIGDSFAMTWQLAAFSFLTIVYLASLRRWMKRVFTGDVTMTATDFNHDYLGRTGRVTAAIEPPLAGRVEIGDAAWNAVAAEPIAVGATVKVISQNNLTMKVEEVK